MSRTVVAIEVRSPLVRAKPVLSLRVRVAYAQIDATSPASVETIEASCVLLVSIS